MAARAPSRERARMRGAGALLRSWRPRAGPAGGAAGTAEGGAARWGREERAECSACARSLCHATSLGIVSPPPLKLACTEPLRFAPRPAPRQLSEPVSGARRSGGWRRGERGLNGWVGGFDRAGAANGLTSPGRRDSSHPLTLTVESFLLSPVSGSFAFLLGWGGESSERGLQPLPPPHYPG